MTDADRDAIAEARRRHVENIRKRIAGDAYESGSKLREALSRMLLELDPPARRKAGKRRRKSGKSTPKALTCTAAAAAMANGMRTFKDSAAS